MTYTELFTTIIITIICMIVGLVLIAIPPVLFFMWREDKTEHFLLFMSAVFGFIIYGFFLATALDIYYK